MGLNSFALGAFWGLENPARLCQADCDHGGWWRRGMDGARSVHGNGNMGPRGPGLRVSRTRLVGLTPATNMNVLFDLIAAPIVCGRAGLALTDPGDSFPPTPPVMRSVSIGLLLGVMSLFSAPTAVAAGAVRAETPRGVLRVAAISSLCLPGAVPANLERHALWTDRAVAQGARFVGFPECSITGYDFSPAAGVDLDGPEVRAIAALAKTRGIYVSAGLIENRGAKKFNTHVLFGPQGLVGVMRKINLTLGEKAYFTAGTEFPVFDVEGVKVSIAICADATQFETVHVLALRGAQVIFVPHATYLAGTPQSWFDWRASRWEWFAKDSCVYLVGCNNAGRFEAPREKRLNLRFASGALIVDPDGKVLRQSEPTTNVETMIVADISAAGIEKKREGLASFNNLAMAQFYGELVKDSPYAKQAKGKLPSGESK